MSIRQSFDREKAIESVLFVAKTIPDYYPLLKVLYLADKLHLERYGRLINGDNFSAMKNGPVPSCTYDLIKEAKRATDKGEDRGFGFDVKQFTVVPQRNPDKESLSETDVECLNEIVESFKHKTWALKDASHDEAYKAYWKKPGKSVPMPLDDIIRLTIPESDDLLEHLGY